MNPRVLSVYRTYFPDPPGGLQEAIRQICLSTQKFGVDNTIFTLSPRPIPQRIESMEADVVRYKSWWAPASCDLGDPRAFFAFKRLSRKTDLLHYFFPWPFADVLHAVSSPTPPAMMTYISDVVRQRWLGKLYQPLMESTLRNMKVIVANAPGYVDSSAILSRPEIRKKVEIIPLGIDETSYPRPAQASVLTQFGLHPNEKFFVFVGVHRYYKGLHFLLQAARATQAKIVIIGTGPESASLRQTVLAEGLNSVCFTGQVSDEVKLALIRHSIALVLPSHLRSEAYGMVLVEAAMSGRPMISCEIGTGTSFVNKHMRTGIVVKPQDPGALAVAMNSFVADEAMTREMGFAARQRYEQLFSGSACGKAYGEVYQQVLTR